MLSLAKIALGVSTVLRETKCFLTPMSIKAAFSWLSAKIAQLQIKNSEKKNYMCIFPIIVIMKLRKNMQHTHASCGFRRMLASQVLNSGDNATLSCFQIVFCLGNSVSEAPLQRPRPS